MLQSLVRVRRSSLQPLALEAHDDLGGQPQLDAHLGPAHSVGFAQGDLLEAGALGLLRLGILLLLLALFLVIVVMAVQYESIKNPFVILIGALFTTIGIAFGLEFFLQQQLSMPAKIGIIMLVGIVVNNSIVLIEQIEIQKEKGQLLLDAIKEAARLRLRPILMTTLTTVMGMLPLAIGLGEGSEMLKPMATIIVFGLSFAMLVSLFIIPIIYKLSHVRDKS